MRKWLVLTAVFVGLLGAAGQSSIGQQPDVPVLKDAPGVLGGKVKLVSRDQLRAGPGTKTARMPRPLRVALGAGADVVSPPAAWDWTTKAGKRVTLPMLGNDRYGDCYPVTTVKLPIMWAWQVSGKQLTFDQNALVRRYLQIAGGDNGTDDATIFPEFKRGVIGPDGPHKALDILIVPPTDNAVIDLTGWAFGPHMFTFDVYANFLDGAKAGAKFTGSSGKLEGGHAVPLSGRNGDGSRNLETWALQPSIQVTNSWVQSVNAEFIAVFSLEWFDAKGYAPNGLHYNVLAPLWNSLGGHVPIPGPFPDPNVNPPPPPNPLSPVVFGVGDFTPSGQAKLKQLGVESWTFQPLKP